MIRIELGNLPPAALSPNACRYSHWSHRDKARKEWRELVYYLAVEAKDRYPYDKPFHKARLTWTFIYRLNRKRDADNLISACKVAQDSLVKAGIIEADDSEHLILMPVNIIVDKTQLSQAIIEIKEVSI